MATKTVVCPDCGAASAPGRYACSECGALLASVALTPRTWAGEDDSTARQAVRGVGAEESAGGAAAAVPEEGADGAIGAIGASLPDEDIAEDAAASPPAEPDVLRDACEPGDHDPSRDVSGAFAGSPGPATDGGWSTGPTPAAPMEPSWPPRGDTGPRDAPAPRTPAGAYLPPSAVLPPLDGSGAALAAASASVGGGTSGSVTASASRALEALSGALGGLRRPEAAARGPIVVGAGIVLIGFLLPWLNGPLNEGAFAGYLTRWGLAGSAMWLVFLGVAGLGVVAASSGRASSWPLGLPAVVFGAFLVGILWPYLLGAVNRSIGVWFVLVGALILAVGGALDRRPRHDAAGPAVPNAEPGGR